MGKDMRKGMVLLAGMILLAATVTAAAETKESMKEEGFDCAKTLAQRCESCHYRTRICARIGRTSERKWLGIIRRMIRHGAKLDDGQARNLARCLAALGPENELCR